MKIVSHEKELSFFEIQLWKKAIVTGLQTCYYAYQYAINMTRMRKTYDQQQSLPCFDVICPKNDTFP